MNKQCFRPHFIISLVVSALLSSFSMVTAADLLQEAKEGRVNWSTGLVTANGIGAPPKDLKNQAQIRAMAQRAAITVARRNLLEVLKGVNIDSSTTVENFILSSDVIRTQVSGILQGSQVMQIKYFADGSVEATVGVYLRGDLASVLMPPSLFPETPALPSPSPGVKKTERPASPHSSIPREQEASGARDSAGEPIKTAVAPSPPIASKKESKAEIAPPLAPEKAPEPPKPVVTTPAPSPRAATPSTPPAPEKAAEKKEPAPEEKPKKAETQLPEAAPPLTATGLVVDARGLGLKPALLPRILDEGGGEIYSTRQVSRQIAVDQGLVGYAKEVAAAQRNIRVTDKPLLVKGIKAAGKEKTDVVVPESDASVIVAAASASKFLEKSRVIIVYD